MSEKLILKYLFLAIFGYLIYYCFNSYLDIVTINVVNAIVKKNNYNFNTIRFNNFDIYCEYEFLENNQIKYCSSIQTFPKNNNIKDVREYFNNTAYLLCPENSKQQIFVGSNGKCDISYKSVVKKIMTETYCMVAFICSLLLLTFFKIKNNIPTK